MSLSQPVAVNSNLISPDTAFDDNESSLSDVMLPDGKHHDSFALSVVMFTLCFVGFMGNTVSAIIFSRRSMRSSINTLLTGLSVIDTLVLLFAVPVFAAPAFTEAVPDLSVVLNHVYPYIVLVLYPLSMVFQTSSVWIFVVINVERYLAVCHPFCVRKFFTTNRTRLTLAGIVSFSFMYNFVRFWEYRYDPNRGISMLLRNDKSFYYIYFTTLYLLTHFAGPFACIIALNGLMLKSITNSRRLRRALTKRALMQQRTTHMIVVVTVMFGTCNTLPFVINIWEALEPAKFDIENLSKSVLLVTDVSNSLVILNSSTTFLIYLVYCRKYRRMFFKMFSGGRYIESSFATGGTNGPMGSEYVACNADVGNSVASAVQYRLRSYSDRTIVVKPQYTRHRTPTRRAQSMVYETFNAFSRIDDWEGDRV